VEQRQRAKQGVAVAREGCSSLKRLSYTLSNVVGWSKAQAGREIIVQRRGQTSWAKWVFS